MENEFAELIKDFKERGGAYLSKPNPTADDRAAAEMLLGIAEILEKDYK